MYECICESKYILVYACLIKILIYSGMTILLYFWWRLGEQRFLDNPVEFVFPFINSSSDQPCPLLADSRQKWHKKISSLDPWHCKQSPNDWQTVWILALFGTLLAYGKEWHKICLLMPSRWLHLITTYCVAFKYLNRDAMSG